MPASQISQSKQNFKVRMLRSNFYPENAVIFVSAPKKDEAKGFSWSVMENC